MTIRMTRPAGFVLALLLGFSSLAHSETVRLEDTADVWLSAIGKELDTSGGKAPRIKLKSIQELGLFRFDASPARGREVIKASLYLHRQGKDMLRYIRVSTVNQDWAEGEQTQQYGPASGATFNHANADTGKDWAWKGSQVCDVIMSSGYSLAMWAEREELADGWIRVPLEPAMIHAMVAGDTDGLAVMDGGTISLFNNFIHSRETKPFAPYIEVELGEAIHAVPEAPKVTVRRAPERSRLESGASHITIAPADDAFCYRLKLDGQPVDRWRVKHPTPGQATEFYLAELPARKSFDLQVVAVGKGGAESKPVTVTMESSHALSQAVQLDTFRKPEAVGTGYEQEGVMRVWACPAMTKISPQKPEPLFDDVGAGGDFRQANAVFDGKTIRLHGARGEYVGFQVGIERLCKGALEDVQVSLTPFRSADGRDVVAQSDLELYLNWYARNGKKQWQPAYAIPMKSGDAISIPDPRRKMADQQNQTLSVDVYIPKDASGVCHGTLNVQGPGQNAVAIPVELTVHDFVLPDRLSFWPELNSYRIPPNALDYYRLAHQHRAVMNCWRWTPQLKGSGKDIQVDWSRYDKTAGTLLSGEAFANNRRAGAPVEVMYLPFDDSWPTALSPETYDYPTPWPNKGDSREMLNKHYLTSAYIGEALSKSYMDAWHSVQDQFIEHFREKGYDQTEMQCFYGGKKTHRIDYGVNMWWTTDEPYHWDDWLALQYFCREWTTGRKANDASRALWSARADISRPQWQGTVLEGVVDNIYYGTGAFRMYRRCRRLARQTDFKLRCYGSCNGDATSNTGSVVWLLDTYLNGGEAALPWQTLGPEAALDNNDGGRGGNALLVPGKRFGLTVVGDLRLKALREGQQLAEYMEILEDRYGLQREQVKAMVYRAVELKTSTAEGASLDNADALRFGTMKPWEIAELRRTIARLIAEAPTRRE